MKNSRQTRDLIKNISKKKGIDPLVLLKNYMMERLLERIALSEYKDNFILKGGMLVAALVGLDMRSTIDMDTTIKNYPLTMEDIERVFNLIISIEVDDGISMTIKKIEDIRAEDEYNGMRISLEAKMDKTVIPLKVDITTGDEITPREIKHRFHLLLEDRDIEVWAYNVETVLAEKMETILSRELANTRTRDFYDVYILIKLQAENIDFELLKEATLVTAKRRGSEDVLPMGSEILSDIFSDGRMAKAWRAYQKNYGYAKDIGWDEVEVALYKVWNILDIKQEKSIDD